MESVMSKITTELALYRDPLESIRKYYDKIFVNSFQVQWYDLRFLDLSDGIGLLKYYSLLPDDITVKVPYIYKLSKNEQSFLIIGTCHSLSLNVYPQSLINLLLKQKVLVVECFGNVESNESEALQVEMQQENINALPRYYDQEWFEVLPLKCQQFISWFVEGNEFSKELSHSSLQHLACYIIESTLAKLNPMDIDIFKEYGKSTKKVLELEARAQQNYDIDIAIAMLSDEELFKETSVELQECQNNGGLLALYAEESRSYIFGNIVKDRILTDHDKSDDRRNCNWMSKLNKCLSENPEGTLVALGLAHLFGEAGLIPYYYEHGWKIEQVTISGGVVEITS